MSQFDGPPKKEINQSAEPRPLDLRIDLQQSVQSAITLTRDVNRALVNHPNYKEFFDTENTTIPDTLLARIRGGLVEQGSEDISESTVQRALSDFVANVRYEERYYEEVYQETKTVQDIQIGELPEGHSATIWLEKIHSLIAQRKITAQDEAFIEIAQANKDNIAEYFPVSRIGKAVIIGVPDFAMNRIPELRISGRDAEVHHEPLLNGQYIIRVVLLRTGVDENKRKIAIEKEGRSIAHELHHVQSIEQNRISSGPERDLLIDSDYVSGVDWQIQHCIDELAARTIDAGWADFDGYLKSLRNSYIGKKDALEARGAWSSEKQTAWENATKFVAYLEDAVLVIGGKETMSDVTWNFFRHMIAGATGTDDFIQKFEIACAIILSKTPQDS